jgi:hypothetical protein
MSACIIAEVSKLRADEARVCVQMFGGARLLNEPYVYPAEAESIEAAARVVSECAGSAVVISRAGVHAAYVMGRLVTGGPSWALALNEQLQAAGVCTS